MKVTGRYDKHYKMSHTFKSYKPVSDLYNNALKWLKTQEYKKGLIHGRNYCAIDSKTPEKEIIFKIIEYDPLDSNGKYETCKLQFRANASGVDIYLELNYVVYFLFSSDLLHMYDYMFKIMDAVLEDIPIEYLSIIYPEEVIDKRLQGEKNMKKSVTFFIFLMLFLFFLVDNLVVRLISILGLSAWAIDKYVFPTTPDDFYHKMKKKLYTK